MIEIDQGSNEGLRTGRRTSPHHTAPSSRRDRTRFVRDLMPLAGDFRRSSSDAGRSKGCVGILWLVFSFIPSQFVASLFRQEGTKPLQDDCRLNLLFFGDCFEDPGWLRHRVSMFPGHSDGAHAERPSFSPK